jgi:iron complex transport system substrate-binding protein
MFRKSLSICLLALTVLLGACAAPPAIATSTSVPPTTIPTATPITLTDSLGHKVTLTSPATRIVSLAPSNTEILFALGAGDELIGRDDFSDYPAEAQKVPSIGSLYPNVNAEAIVALQPDLVLAAGITNPDDVNALIDLGLTVYATSIARDLDDIYADILAVGQLTGKVTEAEQLVADMRARAQAVASKAANVTNRPKVFYETDDTDPSKPWTRGPGTYADALITLAGGQNVGAVGKDQDFQMSLEEIVNQDPDIIIFSHAAYSGRTKEQVLARTGWESIKAIKNTAVFSIDGNLIDRPGPRVVEGLEELAKLIHPELFK